MNQSSSSGYGIGTILFLIFLVLKLCSVIDWSWWWVTAPLWIPFGIFAVALMIGGVIAIIDESGNERAMRRRR